jgi:hypothetical protein
MRRFTIIGMSLLLFGLSFALYRISYKNMRLEEQLAATEGLTAAAGACSMPPLSSDTAADGQVNIVFPREKPVLVLSANRNCPYCQSALREWVTLLHTFQQVDGFVYDAGASYSNDDLKASGVDSRSVLTSYTYLAPYRDILKKTPTVLLIGRSGRLLAAWNGSLSQRKLRFISSSLQGLM